MQKPVAWLKVHVESEGRKVCRCKSKASVRRPCLLLMIAVCEKGRPELRCLVVVGIIAAVGLRIGCVSLLLRDICLLVP